MIERHSKVFVPVSEVSENSFSIYTAYSSKEKEWLLMEEKENVYVLTEQELKDVFSHAVVQGYFLANEENGNKVSLIGSDAINPIFDHYIKSKTNPQT